MIAFEKLPAITPAPISVVLPVFNQAATIENELQAWLQTLEELKCGYELLVVDDGSLDSTCEIVRGLQATHAELKLHSHDKRRGLGAAFRTGFGAAQNPLVAYAAGGQSYRSADLIPMLRWIDEVHLVAGYRVPATGQHNYRTNWLKRRLAKTCLGVPMRDLGCHFVLARRSIFDRIPIQSNTTFAHIEVLAKANFLGSLMTEVPVMVDSSSADESRWKSDLVRVRAEMMTVFREPDFGTVAETKDAGL